MYQIFEITLKPKEIALKSDDAKIKSLGWYLDDSVLVKEDGGLQYILDLSAFTLKCVMRELFPIDEGKWLPEAFPSREELVNSAMVQLRKLPFDLEVNEVRRIVKHE
jgi:hypothetical protein